MEMSAKCACRRYTGSNETTSELRVGNGCGRVGVKELDQDVTSGQRGLFVVGLHDQEILSASSRLGEADPADKRQCDLSSGDWLIAATLGDCDPLNLQLRRRPEIERRDLHLHFVRQDFMNHHLGPIYVTAQHHGALQTHRSTCELLQILNGVLRQSVPSSRPCDAGRARPVAERADRQAGGTMEARGCSLERKQCGIVRGLIDASGHRD